MRGRAAITGPQYDSPNRSCRSIRLYTISNHRSYPSTACLAANYPGLCGTVSRAPRWASSWTRTRNPVSFGRQVPAVPVDGEVDRRTPRTWGTDGNEGRESVNDVGGHERRRGEADGPPAKQTRPVPASTGTADPAPARPYNSSGTQCRITASIPPRYDGSDPSAG